MYLPHLLTVATLPWETLDVARNVWQDKVTRECTKTDALSLSGCTSLILVNHDTINGCYYRDSVLVQQMLPSIRSIAADAYVFQQDSAPAHHARQTVELLQRETTKFIAPDLWPPNRSDLNPVDYGIWGAIQECLSDASSRHDRYEAALDWHMERFIAEYRWWCWR